MALQPTVNITSRYNQIVPNQQLSVQVAVFNPGSSVAVGSMSVNVTPLFGAFALGSQIFPVPSTVTIAAGATAYFNVSIVFFAPQIGTNPSSNSVAYTLQAVVNDVNGVQGVSPIETVTVYRSSSANSATEYGQFDQSAPLDSGYFGFFF